MSGREELEPGTVVRTNARAGSESVEVVVDRTVKKRAGTVVYEARIGASPVALEVVHGPAGRDDRVRAAITAELDKVAKARAGRAVGARVHGVGLTIAEEALDAPFVVSDWPPGEDAMAKVTRLGPMPAWSASSILEQLADALGAAHDAGVVHRDLTAESLWLIPAPPPATEPALRVSFTGLAKIASEAKRNTLAAMDRPLWMAPEQTETDVVLTAATDVFTFGLLTYWLLVGKVFWKAPEHDVMSLIREMTYDAIPRASERAQQQGAGARVPHGFDAWFAKAVTKRPRDRYQSVREAFGALVPFIRQAIDVQRNESIAAAMRPRPSSPEAAKPPAPAPAAAAAAPPVVAPAPAPAPEPLAPKPEAQKADAQKAISKTVAAEPLSTPAPRESAPAPVPVRVATAEKPVAVDASATLVSLVAASKEEVVPAPRRVEEPIVVPVKSNNDTLIGAPVIEPPPTSAANTLIGYAQPATPVEHTITAPREPEVAKATEAPKVDFAGALARFATPAPPPAAPSGSGAPAPTPQAPPSPPAPTPMTAPQIATPRETPESRAEKRRLMIMVASIIGVILVFGAVGAGITYALVDKDDRTRRERDEDEARERKKKKKESSDGRWSDAASPVPVTSDDPSWGDRDASVTVVDFVDYESMSSRALEGALGECRRRYKPSQLRIVWKSFPEPQHLDGMKAATTGRAVFLSGGNAAFLRFHDDASANTGSLSETSIETWAITAGVKRDEIRAAVRSADTMHKVSTDMDLGQRLGEATAGVLYINGVRYELETSARLFKKIDDALMEASIETDGGTPSDELYVTLSKRNFKKRSPRFGAL